MKDSIQNLIQLLAAQVKRAHDFDGALNVVEERRAACDAANDTIAKLEKMGVDPEEAMEKAEVLAFGYAMSIE